MERVRARLAPAPRSEHDHPVSPPRTYPTAEIASRPAE
jgi:hypothetical protein